MAEVERVSLTEEQKSMLTSKELEKVTKLDSKINILLDEMLKGYNVMKKRIPAKTYEEIAQRQEKINKQLNTLFVQRQEFRDKVASRTRRMDYLELQGTIKRTLEDIQKMKEAIELEKGKQMKNYLITRERELNTELTQLRKEFHKIKRNFEEQKQFINSKMDVKMESNQINRIKQELAKIPKVKGTHQQQQARKRRRR